MTNWQFSWYTLLIVTTLIITLNLIVASWRQRETEVGKWFLVLLTGILIWSTSDLIEISTMQFDLAYFMTRFKYFGIGIFGISWALFILEYTHRHHWVTRRTIALLLIEPIAILLMVWTNPLHGWVWATLDMQPVQNLMVLVVEHNIGFYLHALYYYILLIVTTAALITAMIRFHDRYRGQVTLMVIAIFIPWIGNILFITGNTLIDPTPVAFSIMGLIIALGFIRHDLLNLVPVARHRIVESLYESVIVLDAQERVVDLNPSAKALFHTDQEHAIGLSAAELFRDVPAIMDIVHHKSTKNDIEWLHDGKTRYFSVFESTLYGRDHTIDGQVILMRDITLRKEQENEIARIYHLSMDLLGVAGFDGYLKRVNPAWMALLGYGETELLNTPYVKFVHQDDQFDLRQILQHAVDGTPIIGFECRVCPKEGEPIWVSLNVIAMEDDIYFAGHDITDQKAYTQKIESVNEALQQANRVLSDAHREAEQAAALKSDFLANVSHEIRTPMNAIVGFSELLLESNTDDFPDDLRVLQERIRDSSYELLGIINTIIEISKLESGQENLMNQMFDPHQILQQLEPKIRSSIADKPLELVIRLDEGLPHMLVGDPIKVKNVLQHLIDNAIKFTPQGTITIAAAQPDDKHWRLSVSDSGIGIPPEMHTAIFEPFRQVDGSSRRKYGGTGLGLTLG